MGWLINLEVIVVVDIVCNIMGVVCVVRVFEIV